MKLLDQLKVLRAKDQKITIKDGGTVLLDKDVKDKIPYGVVNREVFSLIIEEDNSVTISLVNKTVKNNGK